MPRYHQASGLHWKADATVWSSSQNLRYLGEIYGNPQSIDEVSRDTRFLSRISELAVCLYMSNFILKRFFDTRYFEADFVPMGHATL